MIGSVRKLRFRVPDGRRVSSKGHPADWGSLAAEVAEKILGEEVWIGLPPHGATRKCV
jgi:hypothetical protein